jgi:SEC-C motif/Nuclease-related domain
MRSGPNPTPRSESEVISEIAALCASPGYAHVLAFICFRDNFVTYREQMTLDDMSHMFRSSRLIRTEITTLLGLMVKQRLNFTRLNKETFENYLHRTEQLLDELHVAIGAPLVSHMKDSLSKSNNPALGNAERKGFFREPIFYGGESAYSFQYRDFSPMKYGKDDDWLKRKKGFSIHSATAVVRAMGDRQNINVMASYKPTSAEDPSNWDLLSGFYLSAEELSAASGVGIDEVRAILDAFTLKCSNIDFNSASDFNAVSATPLIPSTDGKVLLLQQYSMAEALYESPFYWMAEDSEYSATAFNNRGDFTETFTERCLKKVFGKKNVWRNVNLFSGKNKAGEIDVLVTFGDRVIVVQTKSKRLTLEARKGNDNQIKADFEKAIIDSYRQGLLCARHLLANDCTLCDSDRNNIGLPYRPKEVFILNVISDHYPALSFQSRKFLNYEASDEIHPPFVTDVFLLDAMTEMLETPLRLLSYISLRVAYADRLHLAHELVALSFHLKQNLYFEKEHAHVHLGDGIATDLDLAMTVRREGVPGPRTPTGILTRFSGTTFERLLTQIEQMGTPQTIDLGFLLLTLSEDTCQHISSGVDEITRKTRSDGQMHDLTVSIGEAEEGICIHCNPGSFQEASDKLMAHCLYRKYAQRARKWFGLCVDMRGNILLGVRLNFPWEQSDEMDNQTKSMRKRSGTPLLKSSPRRPKPKVGRNELCPCGSGLKYKKCHLGKGL